MSTDPNQPPKGAWYKNEEFIMFQEGKIKAYNEERGFGFIEIEGQKKDVFFHIKDFPNKNLPPKVGEQLKFSVVEERGKLKADNIVRLEVKLESVTHTPQSRAQAHRSHRDRSQAKQAKQGGGLFTTIIGLVIIVGLAYLLYGKYQRWQLAQQPVVTPVQTVVTQPIDSNPNSYRCDGRIHCGQMNSREEARWFVRNCPGTKMDGNNDGEPCENDSRW